MKKMVSLLMALLLVCVGVFCACNKELLLKIEEPFDLEQMAVAQDVLIDTQGKKALSFNLILPTDGYIKMLAYDNTDYTEYFDNTLGIYVTFKNESGEILYQNISIEQGYLEKYYFEKGNITVDVEFENAPKEMNQVAFCWSYAKNLDKPVEIELGSTAAAVAVNQKAKFSFSVEKDSLIKVACAEGCIYEGDCSFYIENSSGKVTEDISIVGTEWASRQVFLPEGDYVLTVCDIEAVATCYIDVEEEFDGVVMEQKDDAVLPAVFGFTSQNEGKRQLVYEVTPKDKYLIVDAIGTGTYYDNEQLLNVVIMKKNGDVIVEETIEGYQRYDISDVEGPIEIEFNAANGCIVEIRTEQ